MPPLVHALHLVQNILRPAKTTEPMVTSVFLAVLAETNQ